MSPVLQPPTHFRIFANLTLTPAALRLLRDGTAGHELCIPGPHDSGGTGVGAAHILFGQPDPLAIAAAPCVRWIQISSSGYTRYDTPEFRTQMARRNIAVCSSAAVFAESCAAHVLSFMLAQSRRLPVALRSRHGQGEPDWHTLRRSCVPLTGQTAVILGYGSIGERLAGMLAPFNMNLLACRRRPRGDEEIPMVTLENLAGALAGADHIVNILPENPDTRHFFNADRFSQAKHGAIFYNIGRGATVDQAALVAALDTGRIAAAWLDVTEPEPLPPGEPLATHPRCYITPHTAGGHEGEVEHLVRHFLCNFRRFSEGELLCDRIM